MKASRTDTRLVAAAITALVALLLTGLLVVSRLRVEATAWPPPEHTTEMIEADEKFVDLFDPAPRPSDPAPAHGTEPEAPAQAPATETPAQAPEPAAPTQAPTTVQNSTSNITPPGPTAEEIEREKLRERARQGVSAAFGAAESDGGDEDEASPANGTGSGTVGGGWIMPSYAKVDSRLTGSIILQAVIDRTGHVVSVGQTGGKAPASADRRLVERCMAEVRRHVFTRSDDNAPERATARITYYFR